MSDVRAILSRNLAEVEARIAAACQRAGGSRQEVTLVAVTKYVETDVARILHELGVAILAESRPQELWKKAAAVPEATWHLVGHLQRNKVERTLPLVKTIHSVDSSRLLEALENEAAKQGRYCDFLVEVKLTTEANKHGFGPAELGRLTNSLRSLRYLRIQGLMTMAALDASPEQSRATFANLRLLRDLLQEELSQPLLHLSMGMTNDFEIAIEEGATLVRIGSALFRGLEGEAS